MDCFTFHQLKNFFHFIVFVILFTSFILSLVTCFTLIFCLNEKLKFIRLELNSAISENSHGLIYIKIFDEGVFQGSFTKV